MDEDAWMAWEDDGGGAWRHPDAWEAGCELGQVADEDYWSALEDAA